MAKYISIHALWNYAVGTDFPNPTYITEIILASKQKFKSGDPYNTVKKNLAKAFLIV